MQNKIIMSAIGVVIISAGLFTPKAAEATVRIRAFGIDICFTGKKNPHGCDSAKASNKRVKVVVLEDNILRDMDKLKGKPVKFVGVAKATIQPIRPIKRTKKGSKIVRP